jgi:hypothetical protein
MTRPASFPCTKASTTSPATGRPVTSTATATTRVGPLVRPDGPPWGGVKRFRPWRRVNLRCGWCAASAVAAAGGTISTVTVPVRNPLAGCRAALRRGDAATARRLLNQLDGQVETGDLLELRARAAYLELGFPATAEFSERACRAYRAVDEPVCAVRAARMLCWLVRREGSDDDRATGRRELTAQGSKAARQQGRR